MEGRIFGRLFGELSISPPRFRGVVAECILRPPVDFFHHGFSRLSKRVWDGWMMLDLDGRPGLENRYLGLLVALSNIPPRDDRVVD